jgi:hypothetical protein
VQISSTLWQKPEIKNSLEVGLVPIIRKLVIRMLEVLTVFLLHIIVTKSEDQRVEGTVSLRVLGMPVYQNCLKLPHIIYKYRIYKYMIKT